MSDKERKLESLDHWSWMWSPKKARIGAVGILGADGIAHGSTEAAMTLSDYWKPRFEGVEVNDDHGSTLLDFAQQCPEGINWDMTREMLEGAIATREDTAPGPDGIPFSACKHRGPEIVDRLYRAFQALSRGERPNHEFNFAKMAFLLKSQPDPGEVPCREPGDMRTLSLSNTDHKLWATLLFSPLTMVAAQVCHVSQQGGMKLRSLQACLLELGS